MYCLYIDITDDTNEGVVALPRTETKRVGELVLQRERFIKVKAGCTKESTPEENRCDSWRFTRIVFLWALEIGGYPFLFPPLNP